MIEYIYNAIRAAAGSNIAITAEITDDNGNDIVDDCYLVIHDKDGSQLVSVSGNYEDGEWTFYIDSNITRELNGRYWYCIKCVDSPLCFKQPIYFK